VEATAVHPNPKTASRRTPPPEQLVTELKRLKAKGYDFDAAWDRAWQNIVWPWDKAAKVDWQTAFRATQETWRRCFENEGNPLTIDLLVTALVSEIDLRDEYAEAA
jgi:hypothetical protein